MADERPLIIALTEDLFLVPRLEDVARGLGFQIQIAEKPGDFGAEGLPVERPVPLTEPLDGPDAAFVRYLVEAQPALLLVDTTCRSLPWRRWIQTVKTSAATRRIPIVAFGPHVESATLDDAEKAGADTVVSRGRFQASLAEILQRSARLIDMEGLRRGCERPLSDLAKSGIEHVASGDFYEAHEALESAWMAENEVEGYLYRALLQVAVAYLHAERGNYAGAVKMLLRVRQWLEPLPEQCRGVDVASLRVHLKAFSKALESVGPERLHEFDRSMFKPIPLAG